MVGTTEYQIFSSMKARVLNPKNQDFKRYSGVGIDNIFLGKEGFKNWFKEIGPRPSLNHSIDRIDNDKGYFSGNIRWATQDVQRENSKPLSNSVYFTYNGITKSQQEWAKELGCASGVIWYHSNIKKQTFDWIYSYFMAKKGKYEF